MKHFHWLVDIPFFRRRQDLSSYFVFGHLSSEFKQFYLLRYQAKHVQCFDDRVLKLIHVKITLHIFIFVVFKQVKLRFKVFFSLESSYFCISVGKMIKVCWTICLLMLRISKVSARLVLSISLLDVDLQLIFLILLQQLIVIHQLQIFNEDCLSQFYSFVSVFHHSIVDICFVIRNQQKPIP